MIINELSNYIVLEIAPPHVMQYELQVVGYLAFNYCEIAVNIQRVMNKLKEILCKMLN